MQIKIGKAVASTGGMGGWIIWKDWPIMWSAIIAAAQIADAVIGKLPWDKEHKAGIELTVALDLLFIESEEEWEHICMGERTIQQIIEALTKLKKTQITTEKKHFPDGLVPNDELVKIAEAEARAYFAAQDAS